MTAKKVLMACCNYWTSPFQVGSHQLARAFAKNGYEVAFISDAISPFHLAKGFSQDFKDRYKVFRQGGISDNEHNIWAYVPASFATPHNKPFLRSDWLYCNWHKFTMPKVTKLVAQKGFDAVDLLYLDSINQVFWLDNISFKRSVLRIADKNSGFEKITAAAIKQEQHLARRVDIVAYTAKSLEPYIKSLQPNCALHLPNGVNFSHFSNEKGAKPIEYQSIKSPIVVYAGAMDVWFDYELVNITAKALPHVSFVLIGPNKLARKRLNIIPNIHLLGRRSYNELPRYLYHADIGIIPFDVKHHRELIDHVNPLKLYEYMASGLSVVSMRWKELENLNSPAKLADSREEFIQYIEDLIQHAGNTEQLRIFAKQFDWNEQIKALL